MKKFLSTKQYLLFAIFYAGFAVWFWFLDGMFASGVCAGGCITLVVIWLVAERDWSQNVLNKKGFHYYNGKCYRLVEFKEE